MLGEYCRYDGKTKKDENIISKFSNYEVIPFCPEAPIFGTPRQRINVMEVDGKKAIITDETNEDVTQKLQKGIERFIDLHPDADIIVLKSKSPSCGLGTTPVLSENKEIIGFGDGLAGKIFRVKYPSVKLVDEQNLPF